MLPKCPTMPCYRRSNLSCSQFFDWSYHSTMLSVSSSTNYHARKRSIPCSQKVLSCSQSVLLCYQRSQPYSQRSLPCSQSVLLCYQRSQPYSQSQRIISYSPRALLCSQLLTFSELQRVLPCSRRAKLCSQKVPQWQKVTRRRGHLGGNDWGRRKFWKFGGNFWCVKAFLC